MSLVDIIALYILGLAAVNSLLLLWFYSPLKTTISEIFLKKTLMPHEFDDWLFIKNQFLGKLLSCWICCSFWLSLIVGLFIQLFYGFLFTFCVITFLTYPSFCYLYKKIID
jgi:hypothetical protein